MYCQLTKKQSVRLRKRLVNTSILLTTLALVAAAVLESMGCDHVACFLIASLGYFVWGSVTASAKEIKPSSIIDICGPVSRFINKNKSNND